MTTLNIFQLFAGRFGLLNPFTNSLRLSAVLLSLLVLAGCASSHKKIAHRPPESTVQKVVDYALSLQGTPYRWGKASPEEGFDCSGFVLHVYREHGLNLPRTAEQMAYALPEVEPDQLKLGDLVFFQTGEKTFSHVGLYIGGESFIHASSAKAAVIISEIYKPYWRQHLVGVRRPSGS